VVGPAWPDRILALDTLYVDALALLIVLGIHFETALYFESALVIAVFGFVGTVAYCKFILRGDVIE
jgi:multicomponent K+:H+ antiporter subunit F